MNTAEHIFGCLVPKRTKTLRKKEVLFHQGDDVKYIYIVNRGKIKLTRCSIDGNPLVLQLAAKGEMVAEASLFSDRYHCMASVDSQSAELSYFDRNDIMAALKESPDAMMEILKVFAHQIRRQRTMLELRNIYSARQRMHAYFQLEADANQQVLLRSSYKDMAHQLGLAHETFYRKLKKLEESGILVRKERVIQLC